MQKPPILFSVVLALVLLTEVNSSIVRFFNKLHFYEFNTQNNNGFESFEYTVQGQGECFKNQTTLKKLPSNTNYFNVETETFIYSNFEKTLSFLIQINFQLKQLISVKGFEIAFETPQHGTACVQILPSELLLKKADTSNQRFQFTLKDPSFLDQNLDHIFYFGRISVKCLVECVDNSKQLCSEENTRVLSDHIGIHTDQPIDPIPLKTDLCMGHVLQQTCIMLYNYGTSKLPDKYAFIIHPIPKEFSGIHADLNIIELEEEQKKLLQNAIENEQTSVDTGFNSYPTHLLTQEQGLMDSILVHDIESYQYQKLKRDIVIKLVPYKATMKEIYYLGLFRGSTPENQCNSTSGGPLRCMCDGTCVNCYNEQNISDQKKALDFVYMNQENKMSRGCINYPFFKSYNFENIKLKKKFQAQSLANHRKSSYPLHQRQSKDNNLFFNRNLMPAVSLNIFQVEGKFEFDVSLRLNDIQHVGNSSLIGRTRYKIRIYSINNDESCTKTSDLIPINVIFINESLLDITEIFLIKGLKISQHLIEVMPISENKIICPNNPSYCIDEGVDNNQVLCVPCNKLLIFLPIINREKMLTNETKKILENDPNFENLLWLSLLNQTTVNNNLKKSLAQLKKEEIYAGVAPNYFRVENYLSPYFCPDKELPPVSVIVHKYYFRFFIPVMIVFMLILVIITLDFYFIHKAKELLIKFNYKKYVVFYLSVYVNEKCQDILKSIVKKYNGLEKIIPDIKFQIISYKTHSLGRATQLDEADLIVYVCGCIEEIEKLSRPIEIGKTEWDHEYNKIHFGKYQSKTINLKFDVSSKSTANLIDKASYKNITLSTNIDNQTPILANEHTNLTARFLNLPAENKEFICCILPGHKMYQNLTDKSHFSYQYKLRPLFPIFTCFKIVYNQILKKFKRTSYMDYNYELYSEHVLRIISNQIAIDIQQNLIENEEYLKSDEALINLQPFENTNCHADNLSDNLYLDD